MVSQKGPEENKMMGQLSQFQLKMLSGFCPDEECKAKLIFPSYDTSIECTDCGQRHERGSLIKVQEVTDPDVVLHSIFKNVLYGKVNSRKGPENVKVLGISNYVCKLISPLLTCYGMEKNSGKAKKLVDMGKPNNFDCSILGNRSFLIDEEHLNVNGYGKDRTGSLNYLADTLEEIKLSNDDEERLVPIHADGDGHCLVHAISRALVGRELFWHSLRKNLQDHFQEHLDKYKMHFKDFIDVSEWSEIIAECAPDFIPPDGEPLGLRNIHIFGLASVLKRPIVLLDSVSGMDCLGDYSGVFLPGFVAPEECKTKGVLNKPLCIAWSSLGRNHYIPLVGIKQKTLPRLPRRMLQKAWGMPDRLINDYIDFDQFGCCVIGGNHCLTDVYIRKLVSAMETEFLENHNVHPSLVADVHQHIFKKLGMAGIKPEVVLHNCQTAVQEKRLYRCLPCQALTQFDLQDQKQYKLSVEGFGCGYNDAQVAVISKLKCSFCKSDRIRLVNGNGTIQYQNGDPTTTRATQSKCSCGYKHYWNGKEYDNLPKRFPITLEWNNQTVLEEVLWFQSESDASLNSNVFKIAQDLVQKRFPGEFGSERLVQWVVEKILQQTALKEVEEQPQAALEVSDYDSPPSNWSPMSSSKMILSGQQQKTLHKEELIKSETERRIQKQIAANASQQQQKSSSRLAHTETARADHKQEALTKQTDRVQHKTTPPSTTEAVEKEKKIRLSTSDGRQVMLSLESNITYAYLQKFIDDKLNVPPDRQKIRVGFPPRELSPPDGDSDQPLPLKHGDGLLLEIIPELEPLASQPVANIKQDSLSLPPRKAWTLPDQEAATQSADQLLEELEELTKKAPEHLDLAIESLVLAAKLSGKDVWSYFQHQPHLFSPGGLIYQQLERDLGLKDKKHITVPALPDKVFRYSAKDDRLELCLEPYGHFPIEPDVETKAKKQRTEQDGTGGLKIGTGGVVGAKSDKQQQQHLNQIPFSGQGHSLRPLPEYKVIPAGLDMSSGEGRAKHVEGSHTDQDSNYQRLGPGFSVLNSTSTKSKVDLISLLANNIDKEVPDDYESSAPEQEKFEEKSASSAEEMDTS